MPLTERFDLRGGEPCWHDLAGDALAEEQVPEVSEVVVVGAGITGAMLAWRLAKAGRQVTILDRRVPTTGSIAASTALVMWAADTPLIRLSSMCGPETAQRAWQRVHRAVEDLDEAVRAARITCDWRARPELYLAGTMLDPGRLRQEAEARAAADLPSSFLPAGEVAERFGLPPRAALLSAHSYSVDPVALALGFLDAAQRLGATLCFPVSADAIAHRAGGVTVTTDSGVAIEAGIVILATGYEAPRLYLPQVFAIGSSFAIATPPGTAPLADDAPMLWEASNPYLYARTTSDGRMIVGGEDVDGGDPATRDALLPSKRGRLAALGGAMLGREPLAVDCAWSAAFGRSLDGLPAIGRARNGERVWLASGFGGNGISFAFLAAQLISTALAGRPDPDAALFSPYRFDRR